MKATLHCVINDGRAGLEVNPKEFGLTYEIVDDYSLDSNFDDFGRQFCVVKVEGDKKDIERYAETCQKDLDTKYNGEVFTNEEGEEEAYSLNVELELKEDL
jgi:hypothetical protein